MDEQDRICETAYIPWAPIELLLRPMTNKMFEVVCLLDRVKRQRDNDRIAESHELNMTSFMRHLCTRYVFTYKCINSK